MKFNYIELGEHQTSQNEDLLQKRTDDMQDYFERNQSEHVSTLIYSDFNRQIYKIDSDSAENSDDKTLIYVRFLEQLPQIKQIISKRSVKLVGQFVKYDIVGDNNSQLVLQTITSSKFRVPYTEIYKNFISIDQLLKILKRFIKIIFNLHQQGINFLDLNEGNFEIDIQNYKPSMIAVPLCIRNDISQSESCLRDFEELGLMMLKLVDKGQTQFENELSSEQARLKNCVLKICQEFIDCRHVSKNLQDFIQIQLNRLTSIKQISQNITQSVQEVNSNQFNSNNGEKNTEKFNQQIEALEVDILGDIPQAYKSSVTQNPKTFKERCLNKILCTVAFILAIIMILLIWNSRQSPFECTTNKEKSDTLICQVKLEKQGVFYTSFDIDSSIINLTIDFRELNIKADKIIEILSSIDITFLYNLSLNVQGNDITSEGFQQLILYINDKNIATIDLNIYNTPVSNNYGDIYRENIQKAYQSMNDLYKFYHQQTYGKDFIFNLISDFTGYFNALCYIEENKDVTNIHGNKNILLQNKQLKDSEAWYIIDELYKQLENSQQLNDNYYYIDISNNQIEGDCLINFIDKYFKNNMNFITLHFQISSNPISLEKYQQLIKQFQQLNNAIKIQLNLDIFQFQSTDDFVQQTFYDKKSNLKYFQLEIQLKDLSIKNIYSISKLMIDLYIPFDILIQSNIDGIDQFVDNFPFGNDFCSKYDKILNTNKQYQVNIVSSLTRVRNEDRICSQFQDDEKEREQKQQQGLTLQTLEISSHQNIRKTLVIQNDSVQEYFMKLVYNKNKAKDYEDAASILLQNSQYTQLKNIFISDNYISDQGINNIVELGLKNMNLKTLKIELEFILMLKKSISNLLDIVSKHQSLEQLTLILNQERFIFQNSNLEPLSTTIDTLDAIENSIIQSKSLKSLQIQDKNFSFASFKNLIKVVEEQPSIVNLTIHYNITNQTYKDIRDMYVLKRRFIDRQKNIQYISHDANIQTDSYQIEQFYEKILFHLREQEKSVFIYSSANQLFNRMMIDDFIVELDYAKSHDIGVITRDQNFNSQDLIQISQKISKNSYIKIFQMHSDNKIILKRQEVNDILEFFAQNKSLEDLSLIIYVEQDPKNIAIEQQLKKLIIQSKIVNFDLSCDNCFQNYQKFDDILKEVFKSQQLKNFYINDNKYLNDQNNKKIAFMAVASDKSLLNPQYLQLSTIQEQFQYYIKEFQENMENLQFKLSLSNANITDYEMEFLKKYIERVGQKKEILINLSNNNITNKGLQYLADSLNKQQQIELLSIELQNNQLNDESCNLIMESISSKMINSIKLNLTKNNFIGNQCLQSIRNNLNNYVELTNISLDLPYLGQPSIYKISQQLVKLTKLNKISLTIDEEQLAIQEAKDIGTMFGKHQYIESISIANQYKRMIEQYFNIQKQLKQVKTTKQINIDLSSTFQYPESLERILNQIDSDIKILDINLSSNRINEDCAEVVSQFIEKQSLTLNQLSLNISDNPVDQISCITISETISKLEQLQQFSFNITNTNIDENCLDKLANEMKDLKNIIKVQIIANDFSEEQKQKAINYFKQLQISVSIN